MTESQVYSISEITRTVKLLIEENIPTIWLEGEISNFKAHYSGHYYFTLKDESAQISAVMWKSRTSALAFEPEDGMLVQALGNIRLYEKSGRYQIDIMRMQPAGVGRLQQEFEQLKLKLQSEGLFDPARKKELPRFPQAIGVVTSSTGAAVRDIINVLSRRAPQVQIIVRPAKVQGEGAAADIGRAIDEFNQYGNVDLLIVGRGGGSLEDLWAFNEEEVARAIDRSKLPVISAVGHEVDFTIADFVADLRAATPSAAAELAVPDYLELKEQLLYLQTKLHSSVNTKIQNLKEKVNAFQRSYGLRRPEDLLKQYAYQVDELAAGLIRNYSGRTRQLRDYVNQLNLRLVNLSPRKVLERGYSITYIKDRIVTDLSAVNKDDELVTEMVEGNIVSRVTNTKKGNIRAEKETNI